MDLGCGNGSLTCLIAQQISDGIISGVDINEAMIKQTEQTLLNNNITNYRLFQLDAVRINFENEFDAFFSNLVLHFIPNLPHLFKKLYNALKPQGRLMISMLADPNDFNKGNENSPFQSYSIPGLSIIVKDALMETANSDYFKPQISNFTQLELLISFFDTNEIAGQPFNSIKNSLEKASFNNINIDYQIFTAHYETIDDYCAYLQAIIWPSIIKFVPDALKTEFVQEAIVNIKQRVQNLDGFEQNSGVSMTLPIAFITAQKL